MVSGSQGVIYSKLSIYLNSLRDHLHPFSIATNIIQSDRARLDTVLLTLAKLHHVFSQVTNIDDDTRELVQSNLEKRWKRLGPDREVFILAVAFNPYLKTRCFRASNPALTAGALSLMFCRVFHRLMGQQPNSELVAAFDKYIRGLGRWSDASLQLDDWRQRAALDVSTILQIYL